MENRVKTINPLQKSYTFLDYKVLPELREIHRVKIPIKMGKKSFDILLVLIENQGRVVTKEWLIEKVWPNQVVTDAALNKQIARLRNDLVGNETAQPIIETVRGVGIRLVPPVNQLETKSPNIRNNHSKKWWWVALAVIIALFFYTQFNKVSTTSQIVSPALSLQDTMVEIRSAMSINKKAFISQIKRRNELGKMLNKRFDIEKNLSWERRFLKYHDRMNEDELFVFSQIRAYTEGPLLSSNQQILDLINAKKEIIDEIPSADKLRNHLILWLNKYQKVFKNNAKMSLLYVGVEDGVPYPSEVDEQVVNWLEQHTEALQTKAPISLNIAIVPSEKANDWLNVGGLNYLSEQLQKHQQIQAIKPKLESFNQGNSKHMAIEITQAEGIDYVLSVNNYLKNKRYYSKVSLRNSSKILAKKTISANSMADLFEHLNSWTIRQLKNASEIETGAVFGYKPTDYALESYIKGLDVAQNNSFEKATVLLNSAVNDDSDFFSAWLLLIEIELQLGNYNKASAIINTLENRDDFDTSMLNDLYNVKALVLFYLNKLPESLEVAKKAMQLSEQKLDHHALIKALETQVMVDFNSQNLDEHTIKKMQRVASLTKKYNPTPYRIALTNLQLASTYQATGQPEPAINHINIALEMFEKENNIRQIVSSYSIMTRIYNELANPAKAMQVVENHESYFKQIDSYLLQIRFLNNKSEAQMYFGLRKQAQISIHKLRDLSLTNTGNEAKVIALILQIDMDILYQDFESAKRPMQQLMQIAKTNPDSFPPIYKSMIKVYNLLVNSLNEPYTEVRKELSQQFLLDHELETKYEKELTLIKANLLKQEGFKDEAVKAYRRAMNGYMKVNNVRYGLYAGYSILDIQWINDKENYIKTMNYLDELSTFKYPIHKYKAQYLAYNKDYINAYVMMADLKAKANEFWTTQDQITLEEYQQLAQ